ncbi:MAG: hypothetical protein QXJ75_06595 [Candidatus Bathyarchaeia archaeon]
MKFISLISGGLDSPVATYLVGVQRGVEIIPVHFDNYPFSERVTRLRALRCCSRLARLVKMEGLYVFPNGRNLVEFIEHCNRKLTCILCKRMMLRVTEKFAEEVGAAALVTGESLGQVASQTLTNMYVEGSAVSIPVFRPLIGLDKKEIVNLARKIGTYTDSISPASYCSGSPNKPATKSKLDKVLAEEEKVDMQTLLFKTLEGRERLELLV